MRSIFPLLALAMLCAVQTADAQAPTWSTDVAAIVYNKCGSCHRPAGIAPFSLLGYAETSTHGISVKAATQSGEMPPWPPDPAYRRLAHERLLSGEEKAKIAAWVDAGMPQGNPAAAPPTPVYPADGDLPGTASLTLQIPTYTIPNITTDMYRCFVLPTGQTAEKYITALEAIPGNRSIVHHVLVFADTTGICAQMDAADPGPGYTSFGGVGTSNAFLIGGWVPGTQPQQYPSGFGVRLPQNAKVVVQIHYPAGTTGQVDSTRLRFFFSPAPTVRNVQIIAALNHSTNITPALYIPANTVRTFKEEQNNPFNLSLIGVAPHMHLLGQNIRVFGVTQANDTQKYIDIPHWDFHWQGFYNMRSLLKIPMGTKLFAHATYDNTVNNPNNPSNPPVDVQLGEGTTDEMMLVYFVVAAYQPGDENITIDASAPVGVPGTPYYSGNMLLQPFPNPASGVLYIKTHFDQPGQADIRLIGTDGRVAAALQKLDIPGGYSVRQLDLAGVSSGTYRLVMCSAGHTSTQSVVVTH